MSAGARGWLRTFDISPMTSDADWQPFELATSTTEDERAVCCYFGKVFHFWQGRNAYWGSWSSLYPGHKAFWPDLEAAKKEIASRRVQGSTWTLVDVPVVVIAGKKKALVVGEINTDVPLDGFVPFRRRLSTLSEFGAYFKPHKRNSVFRILCPNGIVKPAELPFRERRSSSYGGYYKLDWTGSLSNHSIDPVLRLVSQINKCLRQALTVELLA